MLNFTLVSLYLAISGFSGLPVIPSEISQNLPNVNIQIVGNETEKNGKDIVSTEEYVRSYFSDTPILAEIARCESHFRQTDEAGNILRGKRDPRDVGVMQINEYFHLNKAKELNHDIYTLEGNMAHARYLYEKTGAKPWMASSQCWSGINQNELAKK